MHAVVLHAPSQYSQLLGKDDRLIEYSNHLDKNVDFVHAFYTNVESLYAEFPTLIQHLNQKGMIWISWPKKSAKAKTDLNENLVRENGLSLGIVDVKVCAVDTTWSGLKFLRRKS